MLEALITSRTRIKLLLKFFLNSENKSYLRGLEAEFGESSNAVRLELNRFEEAGLLVSTIEGNKKIYQANKSNSIFNDLHSLLKKYIGLDEIIVGVLSRIGHLQCAYLVGDFARGIDSSVIELVLIGESFDENYLQQLVKKVEAVIRRTIVITKRSVPLPLEFLEANKALLIWQKEQGRR